MACDERGHRALEDALTKMREERNEQTDRALRLHGNVVGLEARIRDLETALHDLRSLLACAQVQAEIADRTIAKIRAVLAEA